MGFVGALDALFLVFCLIHIPTTILVDAQSVIPAKYYPTALKELVQWHVETNGDHLISKNPTWYVSLVACEVLFQLPFFFIATYAFIKRANWIRTPCIAYGAHVVTTLVPILSDILFGPESGPKRVTLFAINLPFAIIPLMLVVRMAAVSEPFPASGGSRKKKGGKSKAQ